MIREHRLQVVIICVAAFILVFDNLRKSVLIEQTDGHPVKDYWIRPISIDEPFRFDESQQQDQQRQQSSSLSLTSSTASTSSASSTTSETPATSALSWSSSSSSSSPSKNTTYTFDYLQSIRELNILVFITTIFSTQHIEYFNCCWPRLMAYSPLLSNAHITIFANNHTQQPSHDMDQMQSLFIHNPSFQFKFLEEDTINHTNVYLNKDKKLQMGANLGLELASKNEWFKPYEWMIRINPDVLIRNSDWIIETMKNTTIDAIFMMCVSRKVHTDFFAVRTSLFNHSTFSVMVDANHERTAYTYFRPVLESGRYALLPMDGRSRGFCRVGHNFPKTAIVYHGHGSCAPPSPVCNDLEGWDTGPIRRTKD
jgi:hypothetical protein